MHASSITLTFHGIGTPPAGIPGDERPYWIGVADFESTLGQAAEAASRLGVRLLVTFDDGNRSDIEIAAPLLESHGLAGFFFPCAARIGAPAYLDAADLRALRDAGFGVGSHGMDHLPWASLQGAALARETAEARGLIEAALGAPVTDAALPFGSYNRRALAAARRAGFERVFSSDPGFSPADAWFARRFSYREGRGMDIEEIIATHGTWQKRLASLLKHRIKAMR